MLYTLAEYLEQFDIPGVGMMRYLSFRGAAAIILSLVIAMIFGGGIIRLLKRRQIGEDIRDLGLEGQVQKNGTPTMGGLIILAAILVPMCLVADLGNIYTLLLIVSTVWLGLIGFADDYIKVFRKNKKGLHGWFKIVGQVGLGIIVGTTMWLSPQIHIRQTVEPASDGTALFSTRRHCKRMRPKKPPKRPFRSSKRANSTTVYSPARGAITAR